MGAPSPGARAPARPTVPGADATARAYARGAAATGVRPRGAGMSVTSGSTAEPSAGPTWGPAQRADAPGARVVVDDVAAAPWSRDATVVVDVFSLVHRLAEDVNGRLKRRHEVAGRPGEPPALTAEQVLPAVGGIVGVLAAHGVTTRSLQLGLPLEPFPHPRTGWRIPTGPDDTAAAQREADLALRRAALAAARAAVGDAVEVVGVGGGLSAFGERGVDERCVLAAVRASWSDPDHDVIVVTWDADVAVAPRLAGDGRILLARDLNADELRELTARLVRHRDGAIATTAPAHVSLRIEALRTMVADGPLGPGAPVRAIAELPRQAVHPVQLVTLDGERFLRDAADVEQRLSSDLAAPHDRTWLEHRTALLGPDRPPLGAIAVVDPFGVLASANRAGIPGRVPDPVSVAAALAPLGVPGPLAQLAVVPDVLTRDHRLVRVAGRLGGRSIRSRIRDRLTARARRAVRAMDAAVEASIAAAADDAIAETVITASTFSASALKKLGTRASALEEKETTTLLIADLLWALERTDLPVLLLTDRPELIATLDHLADVLDADRDVTGRVVRIGLHADPFAPEGLRVKGSGRTSPWSTVLLTGRMLAQLLRLGGDTDADEGSGDAGPGRPEARGPTGPVVTDAIVFDPLRGQFGVVGTDGTWLGTTTLRELVQFPLDALTLPDPGEVDPEVVAHLVDEARRRLSRELHLRLDLRLPLPRTLLARPRDDQLVLPAEALSARVVGHSDGEVRALAGWRGGDRLVTFSVPAQGLVPPVGAVVEVVLATDGGRCVLTAPDLAVLLGDPGGPGAPRPARVTAIDEGDRRVVLLAPFDGAAPPGPGSAPDPTGTEVRCLPLLGPFPAPEVGDVVLVTALDTGLVQAVSTPVRWPT